MTFSDIIVFSVHIMDKVWDRHKDNQGCNKYFRLPAVFFVKDFA